MSDVSETPAPKFVHLHTHTEFSMLDSTIRVGQIAERAKKDGSGAIALTDHDNMFGAVDFYKAAKKAGVKAILGAECSLVPEDRMDANSARTMTIVLLCRDLAGYRNLCFLLSRAYMDTPPKLGRPRIDRPLLEGHAAGLIALSGSLSGEIPQAVLRGNLDEARSLARHYQAVFGRDGFYLEIIRNGIKEQERVNEGLLRISEELEIPLVATADAHYDKREDAGAHEILMCIQLGKSLPSLDTKARITDELYLAPAAEMIERFADLPEAIANTVKIAAMCEVDLGLGKTFLPTYQVPEGFDAASYMGHLARLGLDKRLAKMRALGESPDESVYRPRLELEIECIAKMGFPGYFLIVWDFIAYAKEHGIPVGPGRGSGAGSLVAYALQITDIDPIRYTLLFERFLNPERVSMPDIDIDFCFERRGEVIEYVRERYGRDSVGQIITFGTMKARAAVRDVARVLGLSFAEADRAAKLIPEDLGMTLEKAFEVEKRLHELVAEDPRYERLFEIAKMLEGMNRQPGMHAAGVVIGDKPLWEYVPLYAVHDENGRVMRITQFAKNEVEEAGLVKFDFLGLKTLTVVDHAVRLVNESRLKNGKTAKEREPLDIMAIDLADKSTFDLMSSGNTTGVFQLESSGFKELLRKLRPDAIEDIIAAVALYRPGPLQSGMVDSFIRRKHGQEKVEYPHPLLAEVLKETYGVMVYQEQVMQSASALAGFSLGQADILRRAMGKKKAEEMQKQRASFEAGAATKGVDAKQASDIFDTIEKFAGYGFNKSHSAAYGIISYQTAWLKAHYPSEFMAAMLTSDGDVTDKVVRLIAETRAMGLTVLPPSVNRSDLDFTTADGAIRFGLGAVKGVGQGAVEAILSARADGGMYKDLYDFTERADLKRVNKRVMEALVKCGAFDELGSTRRGLWDELDRAIERGQTTQRDKLAGQFSLFGALVEAPKKAVAKEATLEVLMSKEEWPDKLRLSYEKECLGFYVSGHPLDRYAGDIQRMGLTKIAALEEIDDRREVTIAGVIGEVRERVTKSGNGRMAFIQLEDLTGRIELQVFTKAYPSFEPFLQGDEPILVVGRVQREGDDEEAVQVKFKADSARLLRDVRASSTKRARIELPAEVVTTAHLKHLNDLLRGRADGVQVDMVVNVRGKGKALVKLGDEYRLGMDDELLGKIERLVGKGSVVFA